MILIDCYHDILKGDFYIRSWVSSKNILVFGIKIFLELNFELKEFQTVRPPTQIFLGQTPLPQQFYEQHKWPPSRYFLNVNISCKKLQQVCYVWESLKRSIYRRQSSYTEQPLFNKVSLLGCPNRCNSEGQNCSFLVYFTIN